MKNLKVNGLNKSEPVLRFRQNSAVHESTYESCSNPLLRICSTGESKTFVKPKASVLSTQKSVKSTSEINEMKKQILKELMEMNRIPASYFVLGKDCGRWQTDLDVESIVELVEISSNPAGDIVIKPIEAASVIMQQARMKERKYDESVQIRRVEMAQRPSDAPPRKPIKRLLPIKRAWQAKPPEETGVASTRNHDAQAVTASSPRDKRSEGNVVINSSELYSKITSKGSGSYLSRSDVAAAKNRAKEMSALNGRINVSDTKSMASIAGDREAISRTNFTEPKTISIKPKNDSSIANKDMIKATNLLHIPAESKDILLQQETIPALNKSNIKMVHTIDTHLDNHHINVMFRTINDILTLSNKLKVKYAIDTQRQIVKKCRRLGIDFDKKQIEGPECFKSKEGMLMLKGKLLNTLHNELNRSNGYTGEYLKTPRYFIGGGNNPMLVKSVIKQRWWWSLVDSIDTANFIWTQWKKQKVLNLMPTIEDGKTAEDKKNSLLRLHNHLEGNAQLGNKKEMFYNMRNYYNSINKDPFDVLPLTFHIKEGREDKEYTKFKAAYDELREKGESVWIVKPGENSNRGKGISLVKSLSEVEKILAEDRKDANRTHIVQKYIEHPLLFNKRKFDIRCYGLLTGVNGRVKGYFYKEGYLRTASKDFSLKSTSSKIVHLTNEAVQMKFDDFGKFEPGNKLAYADLQRFLELRHPHVDFFADLLPQIKRLVVDSFRATHGKLDPRGRQLTFEVFGYDFMIDSEFHVYLIEANVNPCLEITSPVTARIVPAMLDNALRIAMDPIFQPPPDFYSSKKNMNEILPEIKHELVYDSLIDGEELEQLDIK